MKDSIYKRIRKEQELTRDDVCSIAGDLGYPLPIERLERIENLKYSIACNEVLILSEIYKKPTLCNYYCSKNCEIGQKYVPAVEEKDLTQIVLELLSAINKIKKSQDRLIEITADGKIDDNEVKDFIRIQNELENMSITIETLQLCIEKMIVENQINLKK